MANGHADPKKSIYHHMVRGSAWAIAMRWAIRVIGLVNTIILVRLLTPFDFGIVAMAALAAGFLDTFARFGVAMMVIRQVDATRADYDTAWTVRLLQGVVLATLLFAAAPLVADYFENDLARAVVMWAALSALIGGFENIGLVKARKELDFALEFRFVLYRRALEFVATVGLALWLRDYWALVFGSMIGVFLGVLVSYRIHPYRPRLSLAKGRAYLSFSAWLVVRNLGRYFNQRIDVLLVGRAETAAFLGIYNVSSGMAKIATQEISTPLARGLYPSFAKLLDRPAELARAFTHSLNALALLCIPIGIGLACVADLFVPVVFGDQWLQAIPYVRWLAVYSVASSLLTIFHTNMLIVTGHDRLSTGLTYLRLAILAPSVFGAFTWAGVEAIPLAAAVATAVLIVPFAYVIRRVFPFTLIDLRSALWRPIMAGAVMALAVVSLQLPGLAEPLQLFIKIAVGGLVYLASVALLWWASGRPSGPDGFVITRGREMIKRLVT